MGPVLGVLTWLALGGADAGLAEPGRRTAAVAVWMAVWWMTEAIPIYATALLPLAAFPLLGVADIRSASAPYGHPLIYLFLGGFLVALAMERAGLHERIARRAIQAVGHHPERIMGAFLATSAGLSMWVSNTATAMVMTPIALSLVSGERRDTGGPFASGLLLCVAYGASIGGVGTLIGTPPNLFLASFAEQSFGQAISFAGWFAATIPLVAVLGIAAWALIARVLFRCPSAELPAAGPTEVIPLSRAEKRVAVVFAVTAAAWMTRPLLTGIEIAGTKPLAGLTDPGIAVCAALVLFVLRGDGDRRLLHWSDTRRLPWGILILFGGGLSLAAAMDTNGVSEFLGRSLSGAAALPLPVLVLSVCALMVFLTEVTSNTATTAAMVPVFAAIAQGAGLPPMLLAVPAAVAASCAFMLPVATPPNAIVFGSGRLPMSAMVKAGFWLNLLSIALVTIWALTLGRFVITAP
jgi:sodium-dependent dicarboxylate transporter 2/3/5